jgi:hypothetical protein
MTAMRYPHRRPSEPDARAHGQANFWMRVLSESAT